jgi:hypothetical protein
MSKRKKALRRQPPKKAHNVGEQDELLAVLTLIYQKTSGKSIRGFANITSVETPGGCICKDWQLGLQEPAYLKTLSITQIKKIAQQHGFLKSPGRFKADIVINGQGISLKSDRGAPPAIVNHTTRNGWEQACRYMNVSIVPTIGVKADGVLTLNSASGSWGVPGALVLDSGALDLNGPKAGKVTAPRPIVKTLFDDTKFSTSKGWEVKISGLESVVSRAPTHEPYPYHNKGVDIKTAFEVTKPTPPPGAPVIPAGVEIQAK